MSKPKVDIKELEKKALEILQKKKDIYFFEDLATELGWSRGYLYEIGLSPDKNDILKEALSKNKKQLKRGLRNKWYNSDNPSSQAMLYKLVADEDELRRLNGSKIELSGANGGSISISQEVDMDKLLKLREMFKE